MQLKNLSLHNFRSYTKSHFTFDPKLTVIVGPNAIGKTNLVEALSILATGKSFRTSKEKQLIAFDLEDRLHACRFKLLAMTKSNLRLSLP